MGRGATWSCGLICRLNLDLILDPKTPSKIFDNLNDF